MYGYPSADAAHLSKKIAAYRVKEPDTKWNKYSEWRFHLRPLPEIHTRCSPELERQASTYPDFGYGGNIGICQCINESACSIHWPATTKSAL